MVSTVCASLIKFIVPVTAAVGLYLLMGGSLTILNFAGFLVIATKMTEPALTVVSSISALRGMSLSGERLDKVMTTPDPSGTDKTSCGESYTFDDVSFHYSEGHDVIHNACFETPAGALTALIGPSGSGKSTLLRLMARFWDHQKGQIRMEGKDLRSIAPESLLAQVSMVMQNAYLFRGTIRENLCFGNEAITEQQMIDACQKARCHDFISALPEGYQTVDQWLHAHGAMSRLAVGDDDAALDNISRHDLGSKAGIDGLDVHIIIGQFTGRIDNILHFPDDGKGDGGDVQVVDAPVAVAQKGAGTAIHCTDHALLRFLLEPAIDIIGQQFRILSEHPPVILPGDLQIVANLLMGCTLDV